MPNDQEYLAALKVPPAVLHEELGRIAELLLRLERRRLRIIFAGLSLGLAFVLTASMSGASSALAGAALFISGLVAARSLPALVRPRLLLFQDADWTKGVSFISRDSGLVRIDDEGVLCVGAQRMGGGKSRITYDAGRHSLTVGTKRKYAGGQHECVVTIALPQALTRAHGHWLVSYFGPRWLARR